MRRIAVSALALLSLASLSACASLEEVTVVEENQPNVHPVENIEETIVYSTENVSTVYTEAPSVKRISAGYDVPMDFDHMYEEIFWGVEEEEEGTAYQFLHVHPGIVNMGDTIVVDWNTMDPQPTEVHLIEVNPNNDSEIINEMTVSESENIRIEISEEEIGKQYTVQYLWKDGEVVTGKTMLGFEFE